MTFWFGFNIIDGSVREVPYDASNYYGDPLFRPGSFEPEAYSPAVNNGIDGGDHFFLDVYGRSRFSGSIDRGAFEQN
ncbi:hypothetical protein [Rubripirellula reticaptiva]|uniref:Uncharacterized protein n=1 Tax=Rubripirellula reticaptiva TaxID=2528013 RepID=A0A5C6ELD7_9BACT|nr:hypothetical protein [Rubripirellula reticaptiva]TWU48426.1 hypothetical protein Poly59_52740 [Rubripirellula reticaptiva]